MRFCTFIINSHFFCYRRQNGLEFLSFFGTVQFEIDSEQRSFLKVKLFYNLSELLKARLVQFM